MMARPSRPRRSFRRLVTGRKLPYTSYIESGAPQVVSFATVQNTSLCTSNDSPDKSVIADLVTVPCQVENGSVIQPRSFIKLTLFADAANTVYGIWVYLNKGGMVAAPASTLTFNQGPQTLANKNLRAHTLFYTRGGIAGVNEHRHIRIPLWRKRLSHMTDGSQLRIVIQNFQPTAGGLYYTGFGRIRTLEG